MKKTMKEKVDVQGTILGLAILAGGMYDAYENLENGEDLISSVGNALVNTSKRRKAVQDAIAKTKGVRK